MLFTNSNELKNYFGIDSISLDDNSTLKTNGNVKISSNVHFQGNCELDEGVTIDNGCVLKDAFIGNDSFVRPYSIIHSSRFGSNNIIGPFCFVRDKSMIENDCIVGSHVEVTRSNIKSNTKISHQAFIGDATIDEGVIIGAGVIFCNFNGIGSQSTSIGSNTLIGSGTMLIAPVTIGSNVIIGAGSIINKEVNKGEKVIQRRN